MQLNRTKLLSDGHVKDNSYLANQVSDQLKRGKFEFMQTSQF